MHYFGIYIELFDWKQPPGQKVKIIHLNWFILVVLGPEIHEFSNFCPYFYSEFGPPFAWLPYINNMHKCWPFDEYSRSTTI